MTHTYKITKQSAVHYQQPLLQGGQESVAT